MLEQTQPRQCNWALPFFVMWTGQQLSLIGSMVAQFALVWWLTKTTGSATVLATATLAAMLPMVILGPFAGALIDRWNRRLVMIAADGFVALAAAGLVVLFWTGSMRVWHVYVIMLLRSIGGGFHWPAMQASSSLMVPERHLARVAGANQTMQGALNIVAPPLGALLLGILPLHGMMAIDVFTALLAIVPLLFISIPQPQRRAVEAPVAGKPSLWKEVGEGLRFIRAWPGFLAILIMATVINFTLNPAFSLVPILVTKHFGGGAWHLGWMDSAWGGGVVLGGLVLSIWGGFRRRMLTTLTGLAGMGLGTLLIGLSPATAFWLALAAILLTGFMNPICNGPVIALTQAIVPKDMQGRVFTVIQSITAGMSPLGLAVAGPVADALGVRTWYLVGGMVCLVMALAALFVPTIMHIEDYRIPAGSTERVPVVAEGSPAGQQQGRRDASVA